MSFEKVKKGVVKRTQRREIGIFVDGINLDRASRRTNKKVDFAALLKSLSGGLEPKVARYYSVIPNEDDSRQHSFFDVVYRAGFEVILKRLPPVGIERQVTTDVEMAADMIAFALGKNELSRDFSYLPDDHTRAFDSYLFSNGNQQKDDAPQKDANIDEEKQANSSVLRVVTVVTPGRDLSYPISLASFFGADTVTADFSTMATGDKMKSAAKWVDLIDSESIWR
jgi:hypothetical protein